MTVNKLIAQLQQYKGNAEVVMRCNREGEYKHSKNYVVEVEEVATDCSSWFGLNDDIVILDMKSPFGIGKMIDKHLKEE